MPDTKLKAYQVQEGDEGYACVVFATNGAAARREGASELGCEWEGVESCRRAPYLDQYAPGPVPPLTLIEHGWRFDCSHCGRIVSEDMADEIEDDGLDPAGFKPRSDGRNGVFCGAGCECAAHMANRGREEAAEALREVFEAKFPDATIVYLHVYGGPKLEAPEDTKRGGGKFVVTFTFPGSQYSSKWEFGSNLFWVPNIDVDAFNSWRGRHAA